MDGETIISWTPANWITVLLMVALGFTVLGFGAKMWQQKQATKGA
jgi:predicted negative regulator of RcsB-dependent stress response